MVWIFQIVELLNVFAHGSNVVLVFEYAPSGLWEALRDNDRPLTIPVIKSYSWMLLQGVQYLHSVRIMHRVNNLILFRHQILYRRRLIIHKKTFFLGFKTS